jgi:hypothetical protein
VGEARCVVAHIKGLYELQLRTIHASPRIFCDETPMPVIVAGPGPASFGRMRRTIAPGEVRRRRRSPTCSPTDAAPPRLPRNWQASPANGEVSITQSVFSRAARPRWRRIAASLQLRVPIVPPRSCSRVRKTQFSLRWQQRRSRELGSPGLTTGHSKTLWS